MKASKKSTKKYTKFVSKDKKTPIDTKKQKKKEPKMKIAESAIVDIVEIEDASETDALNFVGQPEEESADPIDQLTSIDKEEEVSESDVGTIETVTDNGEYHSVSLTGKVRPNSAPRIMWCDRIKTKFKSGDLVNLKLTKMVYKVVSANKDPHTYLIMASGNTVEASAKESEMTFAPQDSVWRSFWEENDPFKVKGINISCPSNGKMK